jgi:cation transport ATPase
VADDDRGPEPGESPKERHDRELIELLNELRVALPGVQVLFAFLLAVPFSRGYARVSSFEKHVFFLSLLATAVSSVFLIAPTTFHRLRWRVEDKEHIVRVGNVLAIAGLFFLAVAMVTAVLMIGDFLFGRAVGLATALSFGAFLLVLWYGIALRAWLVERR